MRQVWPLQEARARGLQSSHGGGVTRDIRSSHEAAQRIFPLLKTQAPVGTGEVGIAHERRFEGAVAREVAARAGERQAERRRLRTHFLLHAHQRVGGTRLDRDQPRQC